MAAPELLLLCATEGEAARIAATMTGACRSLHCGKLCLVGRIGPVVCRLAHTGIGAVNTAAELAYQIEARRPALTLQFGIAGAYVPAGLPVGAVACASEEIYGDVGVLTPTGWQPCDAIGFPLVPGDPPRYNRFPLDAGIVGRAAALCGARVGPFVTVSQCTGVRSLGDDLGRRFGALCESMEGAAAAHVCALYGAPFLEVRAASNLVEDRDRSRWDISGAAAAAQEAVLRIVARLADLLSESESR